MISARIPYPVSHISSIDRVDCRIDDIIDFIISDNNNNENANAGMLADWQFVHKEKFLKSVILFLKYIKYTYFYTK